MDQIIFLISDWGWSLHSFISALLHFWLELLANTHTLTHTETRARERKRQREKTTLKSTSTKSHPTDKTLQGSHCGSFKQF